MQDSAPQATHANAALTDRIGQVCDAVGSFVEYWGFKAIHGRIWAYLAVRCHPLTQAEVARSLRVSRAGVSAAIAELVHHGLVRPVGNGRNAPYEAVMDVWPCISNVLRSREWMLVETARLNLEAALEEARLAKQRGVRHPYSMERLRALLTMTELAQSLLKALISLRSPRGAGGLRTWGDRAVSFMQEVRRLL